MVRAVECCSRSVAYSLAPLQETYIETVYVDVNDEGDCVERVNGIDLKI